MPSVFSSFTADLDGRVIGFLNSSKFAGNALGPMIATSVLAFSSLKWLYLSIGAMALVALVGYIFSFARRRELKS
jgi:MFS family permease